MSPTLLVMLSILVMFGGGFTTLIGVKASNNQTIWLSMSVVIMLIANVIFWSTIYLHKTGYFLDTL